MAPGLPAIAVRAAASAQVFVEDPAHPVLLPDDAHHLGRVLRLRAGEEVIVSDGAGHWARTRWTGGAAAAATAGRAGWPPWAMAPGRAATAACSSRRRLPPS